MTLKASPISNRSIRRICGLKWYKYNRPWKRVAHCDRWGTLSECLLLIVFIPQVVPTYGY